MTSAVQIEQARNLAESLSKIEGVQSAHVDDWNDYGGFNVLVMVSGRYYSDRFIPEGENLEDPQPGKRKRKAIGRISRAIRKVIDGHITAQSIRYADIVQRPQGVYRHLSYGYGACRTFEGYDYSHFKLDVQTFPA